MDIRTRILTRRDLDVMRNSRDLDGLAAALNAEGVNAPISRFITARTILAECKDGAGILDALTTAAQVKNPVKWALTFLSQDSGLDVGHPATSTMIDELVASITLTEAQGAMLKALALHPVVVTRDQVNAAMFNDDGTEKE